MARYSNKLKLLAVALSAGLVLISVVAWLIFAMPKETRVYIDVHSGRQKVVEQWMGVFVSKMVIETTFSRLCKRHYLYTKSIPKWHLDHFQRISILGRTTAGHGEYAGAFHWLKNIVIEMNLHDISGSEERAILSKSLLLLKAGDIKGLRSLAEKVGVGESDYPGGD